MTASPVTNPPHPILSATRLIGRKILGKKCQRPNVKVGDIAIVIPSQPTGTNAKGEDAVRKWKHSKHWTNWVQVVKLGPDCVYFDHSWWKKHDVFMVFPEWGTFLHSLGEGWFILDERALDMGVDSMWHEMLGDPQQRIQSLLPGYVVLQERVQK